MPDRPNARQPRARRALTAWMLLLSSLAVLAIAAVRAEAEDVAQEHAGLELLGRLEIASGKSLQADGVALIVHGTLAHHGMEIIRDLQANLKRQGINTLAITLSLGLNRRTGMFNCMLEHDHRFGDAVEELSAWSDWLKTRGASRIDIIGHSRGGAQAALFAVEEPAQVTGKVVLVAPLVELPPAEAAKRYADQFGGPLAPAIAAAREREDGGQGDMLIDVPGFLNCPQARVTAGAFLDYYEGSRPGIVELLGQITRPTLVVAAGADEMVPGVAEKLGGRSDKVEIATVEGADHFFLDLYGEDLAERIAAFLKAN